MSQIYEYYENGVAIEGVSADTRLSYTCKLCKSKGVVKVIKSGTTLLLIINVRSIYDKCSKLLFTKILF